MAGAESRCGQDGDAGRAQTTQQPQQAPEPTRTAADRSLHARIAINTRWAREPDRKAATAKARAAANDRFEKLVDPDGVLPPEERARRAASARRAHCQRMARRSAEVRRAKALLPPRIRKPRNNDAA